MDQSENEGTWTCPPEDQDFLEELRILINKESVDAKVGIPDYIIADSIYNHVKQLGETMKLRDQVLDGQKIEKEN